MADEQQGPGRFSDPEERARKQARVRGMTDPLGSMGFRETPQRYQREARARRRVFGGAAASFVIGTALIIAANERGAESAPTTPVVTTSTTTGQTVTTQGVPQSQAGTTNITQSSGIASAPDQTDIGASDDSSSNALNSEATDLLTKSRPPLVSIGNNSHDDDRYDDDEHEDHEGDHEDDDDEDEHESSSVVQNQSNTGSSTTAGANGQNEIVITQSQPHTQTGSTGN